MLEQQELSLSSRNYPSAAAQDMLGDKYNSFLVKVEILLLHLPIPAHPVLRGFISGSWGVQVLLLLSGEAMDFAVHEQIPWERICSFGKRGFGSSRIQTQELPHRL